MKQEMLPMPFKDKWLEVLSQEIECEEDFELFQLMYILRLDMFGTIEIK